MKYLKLIIVFAFLSAVLLTSCSHEKAPEVGSMGDLQERQVVEIQPAETMDPSEYEVDFERLDTILADITAEMSQPNILESDILRGWYLGGKEDKKYGTPDTWIFVEDGRNSKWMSPNFTEEEFLADDRELCQKTAGLYQVSCLQTSVEECEYVGESYCRCGEGTKWKDGQGCLLVTERGGFLAINSEELEKGWYFGLPNQKKLNTPDDWIWVELGRKSVWQEPDL